MQISASKTTLNVDHFRQRSPLWKTEMCMQELLNILLAVNILTAIVQLNSSYIEQQNLYKLLNSIRGY